MTRRRAYGTIIKTALAEMQKRLDAADNTTNQSERRQLFLKARNCAAKVLESEERLSSLNESKPFWKQYQARKSIMDELRSLTDRMPWDERPYWTTKLPGDEYYGVWIFTVGCQKI